MTLQNRLYALYDRKALYYLPPFVARSDADAERTFMEAVTTSETSISQYPADFDLVWMGAIDLYSGSLSAPPNGMPLLLINGLSALQSAQAARSRYKSVLGSPPGDLEYAMSSPDRDAS
jgi:hypothetical protein